MTAPDSRDSVELDGGWTSEDRLIQGLRNDGYDEAADLIESLQFRLQALARGPQQAGGEDAWSALETWLGTFADSIPAQAYHELCAIQRSIAADKEFLRGVIDSGRQQQAELLQRAETAEAALREAHEGEVSQVEWEDSDRIIVHIEKDEGDVMMWEDVREGVRVRIAGPRLVRDGDSGEG